MSVNNGASPQGAGAFSVETQNALLRKEKVSNNAWHKFLRNRSAVIGLVIIVFMLMLAICAPLLTSYNPDAIDIINSYKPMLSEGHIFGTDDLGRDLFSRILYGARMSVVVAVGSTALGAVAGIFIGMLSGYIGGALDSTLMRVMDGISAFPYLLLSILLATTFGPGVFNVILAISIGNIPRFARVMRSRVMVVKHEEFCNVEKVLGAPKLRIMFSHILPNTVSDLIVNATLNIGQSIISEASLSFLGVGILLPTASWGSILRTGRECMQSAPQVALLAGLFIFVTAVGFNLAGDGLRDVTDPKMKR